MPYSSPTDPATRLSSTPHAQTGLEPLGSQPAPGVFARATRTIPPWIEPYRVGDAPPSADQLKTLEIPMPRPLPRRRNKNKPSSLVKRVSFDGHVEWDNGKKRNIRDPSSRMRRLVWATNSERGRRWDHLRSDEPVIVSNVLGAKTSSPWSELLHPCEWGHLPEREAHVVAPEVLDQLYPNFDSPVELSLAHEWRGPLRARLWRAVLTNPFVPLLFRMTVLLASAASLALAAHILRNIKGMAAGTNKDSQRGQTILATAVDTLAIPYIGYMLFDEYAGLPLGLRPTEQKVSLVLMDLVFIIFKSSSTTLAFESLVYRQDETTSPGQNETDGSGETEKAFARALAAFQLISLLSWLVNFIINIFRLVRRLGGSQNSDRVRGRRRSPASRPGGHRDGLRSVGGSTSSVNIRARLRAKQVWIP